MIYSTLITDFRTYSIKKKIKKRKKMFLADDKVAKLYIDFVNPFFFFSLQCEAFFYRCGLVQSHDIQNSFRQCFLNQQNLSCSHQNSMSFLSLFFPSSFSSIEMKFWIGTARRRFCHITVLNNKMYILLRKNAHFENVKIFIVFKIRFGYKNRTRARFFFFVILPFLLFSFFFF